MARAETYTLLPLDRFARIAGIHPLHFNQVELHDIAPAETCDMPLLQYSWQNADRVGREEIAQAISSAEQFLADLLGFYPVSNWIADEIQQLPKGVQAELFAANLFSPNGLRSPIRLDKCYLQVGGKQAKTAIGLAQAIVYSDTDADTYNETATIVIATTVTESEEIRVYYPGHSGEDAWEIRPIEVSIAAGIATITFRRELCVLETHLESFTTRAVDGLIDANFLDTTDVYRVYNDVSQQVQFIWETPDAVGFSVQTGAMLVKDGRLGFITVQPASWSTTDEEYTYECFDLGRRPNRIIVNYRSGWMYKSSYIKMEPIWERAITYLALASLDRPLCGCKTLEAFTQYWKESLAQRVSTQGRSTSFQLSKRVLDNPFGTTRAAMYAYDLVRKHQIIR